MWVAKKVFENNIWLKKDVDKKVWLKQLKQN